MSFYGMDTAEVRDLAGQLDEAAGRLGDLIGSIDGRVATTPWEGPDAEEFRGQWRTVRGRAHDLQPTVTRRADELRKQADEQDKASGDVQGLLDKVKNLFGHLRDGVKDLVKGGVNWLKDRGRDLVDAGKKAWDDVLGWGKTNWGNLKELGNSWLGLQKIGFDAIFKGRWPRFTEVVAGGGDFLGDLLNLGGSLLTGEDMHLFDDGEGYAGEVTPTDSFQQPHSIADLIENVRTVGGDDGADVGISVVGDPTHPSGVIVQVPGTEEWDPRSTDNVLDLTGNAALAGPNHSSAGKKAVQDAIEKAYTEQGIPRDTPIMLAGHSQGGMIAAGVASDPDFTSKYNVTNVVTWGSPVDSFPVASDVKMLNLQHANDPVGYLDLEDSYAVPGGPIGVLPLPNTGALAQNANIGSGNVTTDFLPAPKGTSGPFDIEAHKTGYADSATRAAGTPGSPTYNYVNDPSMRAFFPGGGASAQNYQVDLHRKH